jgi:hypothetical protein
MNDDFATMQVLADLAGWHFDALLKGAGCYILVLVDTTGYEMQFKGDTPEEAVRVTCERLSSIVETVRG